MGKKLTAAGWKAFLLAYEPFWNALLASKDLQPHEREALFTAHDMIRQRVTEATDASKRAQDAAKSVKDLICL